MTHEEKIGLLTGLYLQVSQYALYTAFKVTSLYVQTLRNDDYRHGVEEVDLALSESDSRVKEFQGKSEEDILSYLDDKGLSKKEFDSMKKMLKRRDYLVSNFFIDHSKELASQDVQAYDELIDELNKWIDEVTILNQALSKTMNKLIESFSKI